MSNIDRMRDGYARYSDRDFSFVDETFAEDIDWRVPVSEPLVGRAAVLGFFQELTQLFSSHTITLDGYVEDGHRLVCFVTHRLTAPSGETGEVEAVHDWRWRDGQAVSLNEVADAMTFARLTGQLPEPATV